MIGGIVTDPAAIPNGIRTPFTQAERCHEHLIVYLVVAAFDVYDYEFPVFLGFHLRLYLLCIYFVPTVAYFAFAIFRSGSSLSLCYFVKELRMMLDAKGRFCGAP